MVIKLVSVVVFSLIFLTVYPQEKIHYWPIQGQKLGDSIIYKPQDYINEELNYGNLFITAKEGTTVVAPCNGVVNVYNYSYLFSLHYSVTFPIREGSDKEIRESIAKELWDEKKINVDSKYISIVLGINTDKGVYYIRGLRPVKKFKTGYVLRKGEIIGTVGYSYKAVSKPGICIERSLNGTPADPMSAFGLTSTYIHPKKRNKLNHQFTVEQLKEDFVIFRESLEEGHPGLYDYIQKTKLDDLFEQTYLRISQPMSATVFLDLLSPIIRNVRDSHTNLYLDGDENSTSVFSRPSVFFGFLNDSLIVTRSIEKYKQYIGKRVIEINGIKADSLLSVIKRSFVFSLEGFIKSQEDFYMLTLFWSYYFNLYPLDDMEEFTLTFFDGTRRKFPYRKTSACWNIVPDWGKYRGAPSNNVETKKLNHETALLDLNSFQLTEKDKDKTQQFIKEISASSYKNLIIDVRNNDGGYSVEELFALIAKKPFKMLVSSMVNQNVTYRFFKYCTNYPVEERQMFMDYKKIPGKDGYYLPANSFPWNYPNDSIHFDGNIYVLTNEFSQSAAAIFAALVHKYKRGVVVGRETGSAYYQMNASKFANVVLKNTDIRLRIPMVKFSFDSVVQSGIPWGRGVLPDYPVKFTLNELTGEKDQILAHTLALIDKFEKELNIPALQTATNTNRGSLWIFATCLFICIAGGIAWSSKRKDIQNLFYPKKHKRLK